MRLKRGRVFFWVLIAAAVLLAVSAGRGWLASARPARVDEGARWLRVVTLDPKGLTIRKGEGRWAVCQDFELRVLEGRGAKSLLVRGTLFVRGAEFGTDAEGRVFESRPPEYEYSDATYAVSLDGTFGVREAGADEWAAARALTDEERRVAEPDYPLTRKFYSQGGGTLPEGGATRGGLPLARLEVGGAEPANSGWLLSQGGRYVAAFSHTSRRRLFKRPSLFPFSGEDDRIAGGLMFVDVFDAPTGRRLARASKGHGGSFEFNVFEQALWFEGRYFAMPLEGGLGTWLVGVLPG